MFTDTDNSTYITALAYVKRSKNRQEVIRIIATSMKTPTEIVEKMDARFSLVSRILGDLKDKEILVCVNEEDKTGRLYKLTDIGLKIYNNL